MEMIRYHLYCEMAGSLPARASKLLAAAARAYRNRRPRSPHIGQPAEIPVAEECAEAKCRRAHDFVVLLAVGRQQEVALYVYGSAKSRMVISALVVGWRELGCRQCIVDVLHQQFPARIWSQLPLRHVKSGI